MHARNTAADSSLIGPVYTALCAVVAQPITPPSQNLVLTSRNCWHLTIPTVVRVLGLDGTSWWTLEGQLHRQ